jgi:hypothetical protein
MTPSRRAQRRLDTHQAKRRTWLAQELGDGATAGLVLDYITLHAGLAEDIRLAREGFVMPVQHLDPNKVTQQYEPDRTVAAKVIPDLPDEQQWNGHGWHHTMPDLNRDAVNREAIRTAERLRLSKLEGDYQNLLHGELAGVAGWPLHPRLHGWIGEQIHDDATTTLIWGCLQVHRLLTSVIVMTREESLVKRRKAMEARWRYLIEAFERDLGRRPPERGRRNLRGKPVVEYVGPDNVRRFG